MSPLEYLVGLAVVAAMLGGVLFGALRIQSRRLPQLEGAARAVGVGVLASLGVLAVHLVPGALGVLDRLTVLVATAIWVLGATFVKPAPGAGATEGDAGEAEPEGPRWTRAGAVGLVAALGIFTLAVAFNRLVVPPLGIDALSFHLPGVAAWIQSGSIWGIHVYLPDVAPGHYPNNGDVMLLATVLPWRDDFLVHYAMYPFFVLTGVTVYALGRELRATAPASTATACLLAAIPVVAVAALVSTLVDALMLFSFAAGILFLLRHRRSGLTAELVMAGFSLGIAFGTKWYGVSAVACVLVVWGVAVLVADHSPVRLIRQGAVLVGLVLAAGGIWLLRNWIEAGNPFYPVELSPLGVELFRAPPDPVRAQAGASLSQYFGDVPVWLENILPQLRQAVAAPAAVLLAGLALGAAALAAARIRGRETRYGALILAGVACAVLLLLTYSVTPYTAGPRGLLTAPDSRYGVPALLVAAPILAWAAIRARWGVVALLVVSAVAVADALMLMGSGQGSAPALSALDWAAGLAGAVVLAGAIALRRRRPPRIVAVGLAAVAIAAAVVGGFLVQKRYDARRYLTDDPAVTWLVQNAPSGERIGLTGLWTDAGISPVYPAFGPRLGNQVEYISTVDQDTLRRYTDPAAFTAALRSGDYDYVVAGRGRTPGTPAPEAEWAQRAGFRPVAESPRLVLLKAPGS